MTPYALQLQRFLDGCYGSIQPLVNGAPQDRTDYIAAANALDRLARRHGLPAPVIGDALPNGVLLDGTRQGLDGGSPDGLDEFSRAVLRVLERHGVAQVRYAQPAGVDRWRSGWQHRTLADLLR